MFVAVYTADPNGGSVDSNQAALELHFAETDSLLDFVGVLLVDLE